METKFAILRPGATAEAGVVDLPAKPDYRTLNALIEPHLDGGRMERVFVLCYGIYTDMFVREDGVALALPRNDFATQVYRNNFMTHHKGHDPETLAVIHGPAVLFSRKIWW